MNHEPFTFVLERLSPLLINEIKFFSTDKDKLVGNLKQQLELAQSFVRDVEEEKQKATITHVLETEVQHILQILSQIEDFLDTLYKEDEQQSQEQNSCFPKFMACFSYRSNPLVHRHFVIDKAIQLTDDLRATRQRAEPYQRQSTHPQVTRRRRPQTQPNIINDQFIIGLEEDVKTLVAKLVGKDGDSTTILAIAGMGGAGKTTLARKLYNHEEILGRFTSCAWICVSQEWDTPHLFREICVQLNIQLAKCEMSIAGVKIREFLQRSSCFIVLDDVWKKKALQELLPVLRNGSGRMLITTRNKEIVKFPSLGNFHIHKARCLTQEESWDLFSIIVRNVWRGIGSFQDDGELACLGKEMLRKCHGLPLAIIALAGILSAKATIQEWERTKNNVVSSVMTHDSGSHDYGAVKEMLELSYSDLPYDLKPCFLYLGIFKEDSHIYIEDLTQLWIGEGFLRTDQCNECKTLEELAWDFLNELVLRNMVEVEERDDEGKVKIIRVHDLMRDLCIEKAKDLNFFEILSPSTFPSTSKKPMSDQRDICLRGSYSNCNVRLRSIICVFGRLGGKKLEFAYREMKVLRVLRLINVDLGDVEEEIGNLVLLRYLEITRCGGITNKLLESINKLRNLLALIYLPTYACEATISNNMLGNMEYLRYFDVEGIRIEVPVLGLKMSRSLHHLSSPAGEWLIKELNVNSMIDSLWELRLFDIYNQAELDAIHEFVSNPSNHLYRLQLQLGQRSGLEFNLQRMNLTCLPLLKSLLLEGQIRKLSEPFFFPPNLLELILENTKIEKEEYMERALSQLHQLRFLLLDGGYEGHKLFITGLPQLQELCLYRLANLKEWRIEEGALSQLKELSVSECQQLERIPEGISRIHTLQDFRARVMSASFYEKLQLPSEKGDNNDSGGGGEDFHLIRHIPHIDIDFASRTFGFIHRRMLQGYRLHRYG